MLQALETGQVHSNRSGAEPARATLDPGWQELIEHGWAERPAPWSKVHEPAEPSLASRALDLMSHATSISGPPSR